MQTDKTGIFAVIAKVDFEKRVNCAVLKLFKPHEGNLKLEKVKCYLF